MSDYDRDEQPAPPHVHARRLEVVRTLLYVADPAGLLYAGGSDEDYDPYAGPLVEILESDATEAKCGDLISDHFCFPVNQSVVRRLVRAYYVLAP